MNVKFRVAVASRRITNTRTKNWRIIWKFGNLICSNHLWVPCLIHINTFVDIRRYTHTILQQVSPKIKTKRVCYNLPAVRAFVVHVYPPFCRPFRCWQSCHGYENCWLFSSLFVKIEFFREVPDSIILYYDSRCWCNTVSVEKYCNSFHWI